MSQTSEYIRSQQLLQDARDVTEGHDSKTWRGNMFNEFLSKFGKAPYDWQMDVAEALVLKVDTLCIAGTGAGKTIPFMMPLLLDPSSRALIISPLKILQEEQAARFKKMGITAVAVNKDTWNAQLKADIEKGKFQALFTSPEMCLRNEEFRSVLCSPTFTDNLKMVIIDEAHCISQWGGDFRTDYGLLSKLRSFFPPSTPFLATSATLPPAALRDVQAQLQLDPLRTFIVNLGNNRPNIALSVKTIKSTQDFQAVIPLLTRDGVLPTSPNDLIKTCLFVNKVRLALELRRFLQSQFPASLVSSIDMLYSLRSVSSKRRVMKQFTSGEIKVLVATEAAGMGADIPDIEQVIQFGVPSSLSVWVQRAGRAGRSFDINARAVLLVEASTFNQHKASGKSKYSAHGNEDLDIGMEWVKKVEVELRQWIDVKGCRRDYLDIYFNNPPDRKGV
ncbi:P-loop containing nucleoside triphosphate hydrolase protein [Cyathus striatus]|nr:P-loop containing nucleoside triphosphate hydrolase protein [Cyathus striatus]